MQNIYDATPVDRAFLLKFSKTDQKVSVVIESGLRIHSTVFTVEKPNMLPSGFAAKVQEYQKVLVLISCLVEETFEGQENQFNRPNRL